MKLNNLMLLGLLVTMAIHAFDKNKNNQNIKMTNKPMNVIIVNKKMILKCMMMKW